MAKGSNLPMNEPVVVLDSGHVVLDRPGALLELSSDEEAIYLAFQQAVSTALMGACIALAQLGVDQTRARRFLSVALTEQKTAVLSSVGSTPS